MPRRVLRFEEIDATSISLVGGKGANLGELARIDGIRVPPGFCVTTAAYVEVVERDATFTALVDDLCRATAEDGEGVGRLAARIRDTVHHLTLPAGLADEVRAGVARIGADAAFAVRSSATAEDLPTASFAGQQDTYLNVLGVDAVLAHVRMCWASLFTDRAVAYRNQEGIDHREVRLAVVVQRMVSPEMSGVLFTADPLTANRRVVSINAGIGLGEALVSGLVNADDYKVRDGRVVARTVSTQDVAIRAVSGGGTEKVPVEAARGRAQKLTDAQILQLAAIGRRIEAHFGRPQDIEWSVDEGGTFFIVQSRPITTLFPVPASADGKNHVYFSMSHQQMMTDAMTPLGMSFFHATFGGVLVEAAGRLYGDLAPDLASPVGRRIVLAVMGKVDPLMLTAIRRLLRRKEFVKNLARDGERLFSMKGSGYFTWRLPVETVRNYLRDDPTVLDRLKKQDDAAIAALRTKIDALSGDAVFDGIVEDLQRLGKAMSDPRGMGAIYVGTYALSWLNKRMTRWLGEKGVGDALAQFAPGDATSEMGLALLDVADAVREHPAALEALRHADGGDLLVTLRAVDGGAAVADAIEAYLDTYGMRCPGEIDVTRTRWSEDPSQLVPLILTNIARFAPGAHAALLERGRHEVEEKETEDARARPAVARRSSQGREDPADDQSAAPLHRPPRVPEVPDDAALLGPQAGDAARGRGAGPHGHDRQRGRRLLPHLRRVP